MARNKLLVNKQEIIDSAFNLLQSEGIDSFSARRIAKELKVSPMTIYNYVKNIDEIKKEVIIKGFNILYKNLFENIKKDQKSLKQNKIKSICKLMSKSIFDFAMKYPEVYMLMYCIADKNIVRDPEVQPFYGFYEKIIFRFKYDSENYKKCFYVFELVLKGLIVEKLKKINNFSEEELFEYIDCTIDKFFIDERNN